jgi:DNA invertase Pin-like site-specific DNA recombinase
MPRRFIEGQPRHRGQDLWRKVGEPGPGAHCRGYVRFSHEDGIFGLTSESQQQSIREFAEAHKWIVDGFDVEPVRSAKFETIEERPVFTQHLQAAERGVFQVSLCHMNDRWARNKLVALTSLSRLRNADIWWATADGEWNIDRIEENGWDAAYMIDVAKNAAYSRNISVKTRNGKRVRAALGFHNGDISFGYQPPEYPPKPPEEPVTWKPPRMPNQPHPENFSRLQQIGEWLTVASDPEVAARCNALGWLTQTKKAVGPARKRLSRTEDGSPTFEHEHVGPRPFSKDTIRAIRLNWYHREFAQGSGNGTIRTPDGQLVKGLHVAAWSWELWHRIDQATAERRGSRGQQRGAREEHYWLFSGIVVCAACGNRLRADGNFTSTGSHYGYYRDKAMTRGLSCSEGGRLAIREDLLENQYFELLQQYHLPDDFRERIAEIHACEDGREQRETMPDLRQALDGELERVKFQHQHGLISDGELLREVRRIRAASGLLPKRSSETTLARSIEAAETLKTLADCWMDATREERMNYVRLFLMPEGLTYDLPHQRIVAIRPYTAFLPSLRLAYTGWTEGEGVLHAHA